MNEKYQREYEAIQKQIFILLPFDCFATALMAIGAMGIWLDGGVTIHPILSNAIVSYTIFGLGILITIVCSLFLLSLFRAKSKLGAKRQN